MEAAGGKILLKFVVARPCDEDTYEYRHFGHQDRKGPKSDTISDRSDTHNEEKWCFETTVLIDDVSGQMGVPAGSASCIGAGATGLALLCIKCDGG